MGTALKVLKLLDSFSLQQPELGLSQIARMNQINKATALRYLTNLADYGMVEQDPQSKLYSIGTAPLRLANLREAAKPRLTAARKIMKAQVLKVHETMHMSLLKSDLLRTTLVEETQAHSVRISIGASEVLPLHATASGIVSLAFGPRNLLQHVLDGSLPIYSEHTQTNPDRLMDLVDETRRKGWCESVSGYETGVHGFAAPIFGEEQTAIGAIACVIPQPRVTSDLRSAVLDALSIASKEITSVYGGQFPATYRLNQLQTS
ncbi:IclR family transcriptional regulator (plasmid) [Ruegeria conchae]|uniref:IclR family transcriptional regulator n=1 Tax=Ruegeria conchae TaxID=981384 RepID=UPI00147D0DD6|nr:IclR family transcriptional regulator [Ruegeria conchae]UWR05458.1 IclR family transcriptional regulator [Ruegeria conchae]